jgi:hypothetical protein
MRHVHATVSHTLDGVIVLQPFTIVVFACGENN